MRLVLVLVCAHAAAAAAQQSGHRQVAVTFDDVPSVAVSRCTAGAARALNQRLLQAIARNGMPATALVVTGPDRCGADQLDVIVNAWLDAGHEVGSHTFGHRDINTVPTAVYLADVERAHERLTPLLSARGRQLRYFRHPFLHTGATRARKDSLDRYLSGRGYRVAPVTIDNQEWVFAEAYARAKRAADSARVARILPAYLAHLDSSFAYYEGLSQRMFRRQIPQVLLLHANELNADHLDDVARLLRRRGYRFVSLQTALQDSAYRQPDRYVGPSGLSWLQRWALQRGIAFTREPREPSWLRTW
jgi:peptidoglycan/xylan/chitin deacetylase (PgdA/CDA1 family)